MGMKKFIKFKLGNGAVYALPLELVAKARADYLRDEDPGVNYHQEIEYVMEDTFEGIDWFRNNQDPSDFDLSQYLLVHPAKKKSFFEQIEEAEDVSIGFLKED